MSVHVLLNLLNELGKGDKMRGLPSISSFFRNEFNKFNNTRARKLDSIYHMTNTLNLISGVKTLYFCHYVLNVAMDVITFPVNLQTTSGLSILLHGVISLPDATSYDKCRSYMAPFNTRRFIDRTTLQHYNRKQHNVILTSCFWCKRKVSQYWNCR